METEFKRFPEMREELGSRPDTYWRDREARALVRFVARGGVSVSPDDRPNGYLVFDPLGFDEALISVDKMVRGGYAENPLEYVFDPVARVVYHERCWQTLRYDDDADELVQTVTAGMTEVERTISRVRAHFREMPDEVYRRLLPMRDFFLSMAADVLGRRDG